MALRKIVRIREELCNGCGDCITACAEGALKLVDGKAKLVSELFCDGFGDCLQGCPTGAIVIEDREAEEFDLQATRDHVARLGGEDAVRRFEEAAATHSLLHDAAPGAGSELRQWPVQIHLVRPDAPYFRQREIVIMNTCGPLACADVHPRFLRGRAVVVGCPKLDDTRPYAAKLAAIFRESGTAKATVVRMEVPCCGGLTAIAREARQASGRDDMQVEEVILGTDGAIRVSRDALSAPRPPAPASHSHSGGPLGIFQSGPPPKAK